MRYTKELVEPIVRRSKSMAEVMRELGVRPAGGTYCHLKRRIREFGIDTSHFLGQAHMRGKRTSRRMAAQEILVMRPEGSNRQKPHVLRRALSEIGVPFQCAFCGLGDVWQGKPLVLHVDHKNGNFIDCRPENLRYLCPNCHTQTPTFAGKSKGKARVYRGDPATAHTDTSDRRVPVESAS